MREPVPLHLLEALAAEVPDPEPVAKPGRKPSRNGNSEDFEIFETTSQHPEGAEELDPKLEKRVRTYLETMDESIAGDHGHDRLYHVACVLVDGFGLTFRQALPIFRAWNEAKAKPPETESQLVHKLTDALKNTPRSGHLLITNGAAPKAPKAPKGGGGDRVNGTYGAFGAFGAAESVSPNGEDEPEIVAREWPSPPSPIVFHGPAGLFVGTIAPHTESDPLAILGQLLAAFGNMIDRTAHFRVESDSHYANLFVALVGPSAKGRKGTSWGHVRRLMHAIDPIWAETRIFGGLSSGEGLIWAVRDSISKREPIKDKGRVVDYQDVEIDAGIADKRLLALETEFASPLRSIVRDGNTLSAVLRKAWDEGNLRSLTKNSPAVATNAHVSVIGHITRDELARLLTDTDAANGFGNRFLWLCVRRSQFLPFGGRAHAIDWTPLLRSFGLAAQDARSRGEIGRDEDADRVWDVAYRRISEGKPGLLGAILGRAEPQVMRLAMIYALLDRSESIGRVHLEAALALWDYAEASARYIFGDALGDPDAEQLLSALRDSPQGLSRSQIRSDVFQRHKSSAEIARILGRLLEYGLIAREKQETGGRPLELWLASRSV